MVGQRDFSRGAVANRRPPKPPRWPSGAADLWGAGPSASNQNVPAKLAMAADSSACSVDMGGSKPAKRCANMDLPRTRWPQHEQRMARQRRRFPARAFDACLAFHIRQVGIARRALLGVVAAMRAQPSLGSGGTSLEGGKNCCTTSSRWRALKTSASGTKRRLFGAARWQHQPGAHLLLAQHQAHGQSAAHRAAVLPTATAHPQIHSPPVGWHRSAHWPPRCPARWASPDGPSLWAGRPGPGSR